MTCHRCRLGTAIRSSYITFLKVKIKKRDIRTSAFEYSKITFKKEFLLNISFTESDVLGDIIS